MNLTWKTKLVIITVTLTIISAMIFIIKYQYDIIHQNQEIQKSIVEFKQLGDGLARDQSQYATKDQISDFLKSNNIDLKKIQKDLDTLGAKIDGVIIANASSDGFKGSGIGSSYTETNNKKTNPFIVPCKDGSSVVCPNPDAFGYISNTQYLKLTELFNNKPIPFGTVSFDASVDKPWGLDIYPRNYKIATILGVDEEGRHYAYSKFSIETKGESYPIVLKDGKFLEEYPESKFRFNIHPYLGLNTGLTLKQKPPLEITPSAEIFLFSYGKTKNNPKWVFLGLGAGYETQSKYLDFIISPVAYNLAGDLPLINNLFIGPSISVNTNKDVSLYLGIKLGL